jgi:hypothetical protein
MKPTRLILGGVGGAGTALLTTYLLLRPRLHHWGATDAEVRRTLPGDEMIPQPALNYTLAITIKAAGRRGLAMDRAAWTGTRRLVQLRLAGKFDGS